MRDGLGHAADFVPRVEVGEANIAECRLGAHLDTHRRKARKFGVHVFGEIGVMVEAVCTLGHAVMVDVRARASHLDQFELHRSHLAVGNICQESFGWLTAIDEILRLAVTLDKKWADIGDAHPLLDRRIEIVHHIGYLMNVVGLRHFYLACRGWIRRLSVYSRTSGIWICHTFGYCVPAGQGPVTTTARPLY